MILELPSFGSRQNHHLIAAYILKVYLGASGCNIRYMFTLNPVKRISGSSIASGHTYMEP